MSGPITNFELGKMLHREYEAEASRHWGQNAARDEHKISSKRSKLILGLSSATLAILLMALVVVAAI